MPNICDLNLSISVVNDTNSNDKDKGVNTIASESKTVTTPASGTSTEQVLNNNLGYKCRILTTIHVVGYFNGLIDKGTSTGVLPH